MKEAEKCESTQLDSAHAHIRKAYDLVRKESNLEVERNRSILALCKSNFLRFGANDRRYQRIKKCEDWFRDRQLHGDAFKAQLLRLEVKSFMLGEHSVGDDLEELIQSARNVGTNEVLAQAYYFKMATRDYTRKWEDDVHILDSARMFAFRAKDSVLLGKIRVMSVLPRNGKPESVDSIKLTLKEGVDWNNAELKSTAYLALGRSYYPNASKVELALTNLRKGISESKKWGSIPAESENYRYVVGAYSRVAKIDSSILNGKIGIDLARKIGNSQLERQMLSDVGLNYVSKGQEAESIKFILKSLEIAEKTKAEHAMFNVQNYVVILLMKTERYGEARKVLAKMSSYLKKKDQNQANDLDRSLVFYLKGHLMTSETKLDSALYFYRKSADLLDKYESFGQKRFHVESSILKVLVQGNNIENAWKQHDYMVKTFSVADLKDFYFLYSKGKLLAGQGKKEEAIAALSQSFNNGKDRPLKLSYDICTLLSDLYKAKSNYKQAYDYNERAIKIKEEMDKKNDAVQHERLQSKYELSQREQKIQTLEIDKLKSKNDLELAESALKTRQLFVVLLVVLVVLLVVIFLTISRRVKDTILRKELQQTAYEKERQIERLKAEESQRSVDIKNQLFANISHEFRTPLTLINAPVEKLMEDANEEDKTSLEVIKRNTGHLLEMVDEILQLSQLDAGVDILTKKRFALNEFIRKMESNFEPMFNQKDIAFNCSIPEESFSIFGDEYRLKMVLNNLLKNAFHHTPPSGKIMLEVEVHKEDNTVQIAVFNSGDHIKESFLPYIFERYARSQNMDYSGYGIGLSFSKKIVELHNGTITAQNVEGGVKLSFSFPTRLGSDETTIQEEIMKASQTIETYDGEDHAATLLIVEDNAELKNLLKSILSDTYTILSAENGEDGIAIAKESCPDLIISDIMMPKVAGDELVRTLKENFATSHIPIILLTAKSADHDRIFGLQTGADDYVTKPFSPKELKVRVKNLLKQREQLQKRYSKNIFLLPEEITSNSLDQEFLTNATQIILANLQNPKFNVQKFCRELALNRNSVHLKLKTLTGKSATQFIKSIKLKRAAELLADERISIVEVSELSGFNNRQAFYKAFKDELGVTPLVYRQECLKL